MFSTIDGGNNLGTKPNHPHKSRYKRLWYRREARCGVVKRMDKQRISYYNYYTDKRWGVPENYELCLDSSALGIEGSVDLLEDFIKKYFKE